MYMMDGHHKLEAIGEADSEPRGPRSEAAKNAPHGNFRDDLQEYSTVNPNKSHFKSEKPIFEFKTKYWQKRLKIQFTKACRCMVMAHYRLMRRRKSQQPKVQPKPKWLGRVSLIKESMKLPEASALRNTEILLRVAKRGNASASPRKRRVTPSSTVQQDHRGTQYHRDISGGGGPHITSSSGSSSSSRQAFIYSVKSAPQWHSPSLRHDTRAFLGENRLWTGAQLFVPTYVSEHQDQVPHMQEVFSTTPVPICPAV